MMDKDEILSVLGASELFADYTSGYLAMLAERSDHLSFPQGMTIIGEGDANQSLYMLLSGKIRIFLPEKSPAIQRFSELTLRWLEVGDYFGEYSFLDAKPVSASARTMEDSQLMRFNKTTLETLAELEPMIGKIFYRNLVRVCVRRLREKDEELDVCSCS